MITDALDFRWAASSDRIAVREPSLDLSFGQLLAWSQRTSRCLEPLVGQGGQRVAVIMPNCAAFVSAFFGVARVGGVVAPISHRAPVLELSQILADLRPVSILTIPSLLEHVTAALTPLTEPPAVLALSPPDVVDVAIATQPAGVPLPSGDSPPLLQQTTSGSTGHPKRVVRTHAAVEAELRALQRALRVGDGDRFLGVAPFSHVNGLVRTMLTSMWVGAELHPVNTFHRRDVLEALVRHRITVLGAVPHVFVLLARTPSRDPCRLENLRVVFSSSAPLLPEDNLAFHERYGVVIRQLYGSTETGSISYNEDDDASACLESVGRPLDGVTIQILDPSGHPVTPGEEGEIVVSSPFATSGYLDDAASSAQAFRDGAYRTGDIGRVDHAGRLILTGRQKLMINRGGFKVNPYEVEAVLKRHPKVDEAVVFGLPSRHGDEAVACVIVSRTPCSVEEILTHCRARLADFKIPSRVEFRDAIPTGPTGKPLRERIAKQ